MQAQDIPVGLCHCGCGQQTKISPVSNAAKGYVKGQPYLYLKGHGARVKLSLAERFWSKVDKNGPDDCWLWTGSCQGAGYGLIGDGAGGLLLAHRVAYELLVGPIPAGRHIDHVKARGCRHRHCVNPAHLEPVTNAENCRRGGLPKLTMEAASEIRALATEGMSTAAIARHYDVGWTTVARVLRGETWTAT